MKSNDTVVKINRLLDFVSNNEEVSIDEIKNDLKVEGVDVGKFLENVKITVRHGIQNRIRDELAFRSEGREKSFRTHAGEIKGWTLEMCASFLKKIADGESCTQPQQRIAMAFRNRQDSGKQTLEEMRSCIADILSLDGKDEE